MKEQNNTFQNKDLKLLLKKHFGFDTFLKNQEAIIHSVLQGQDTVVIMPTGGGKSLCYQLPALALEGLTLVISPLIALMKDQVDALLANGISAAFYNSSQPVEEQESIHQKIAQNKLKLLYVAPESLSYLALDDKKVSLIAVDEAHCISAWGHDFRPAYQQLGFLKKQFPKTPIIALTATADRATRKDIAVQLHIPNAKTFIASFDRSNLFLDVRPGRNRKKQIYDFLKTHDDESGIIYCLSRKSTEKLAADLHRMGYRAKAYHAGMSAEDRIEVQEAFINDDIPIVVATIAFGMGIDKSNLRWVIHYNLPKNIEGYYQEIGRAGRDSLPAHTILFHSFGDVVMLRRFAEDSSNSKFQLAKLERMQQYAEALTCRRKMLLGYFGEHLIKDCGNCDNCQNPPQYFDGTVIAQKVCSAVARLKERESLNNVVDVLRGAQNTFVFENGYQNIKTYGAAKDISWRDLQDYVIQLINQGALEVWFHENGRLVLTPLAREILFEGRKINLAKISRNKKEGSSKAVKSVGKEAKYPELYKKLRDLRYELAQSTGVPPYIVFGDVSLIDMATRLPQTEDEFATIHGVGKAKLKKYASKFLPVIKSFVGDHTKEAGLFKFDYTPVSTSSETSNKKKTLLDKLLKECDKLAEENGVSSDEICSEESLRILELDQPIKQQHTDAFMLKLNLKHKHYANQFIGVINKHFDKTDKSQSSHERSYSLVTEEGMPPREAAFYRGLSENTVMGHLLKMYQEGHALDIDRYISTEEIKKIISAKDTLEDPEGLRPYFDYFNKKIPYWKIKFALTLGEDT